MKRAEIDYIDDDGIVHLVGEYRVKLADGREMAFMPEGFIWAKFPKPSLWRQIREGAYYLVSGYPPPDPDLR